MRTTTLSAALLPTGTLRVREVRQRLEQHRALPLGAVELDLQLLDLLAARLAGFVEVLDVLALPLGARHLVAGRVLLALEAFDLRESAGGDAIRPWPAAATRW